MQWRGQKRRMNLGSPAARLDERQAIEPANPVRSSDAPVKIEQIRAAAQENMLTVVDDLSRSGMLVGRSTPPDERPALEERNATSGVGQSTAGRESGDASADDSDV
jgi:hypothetical protein